MKKRLLLREYFVLIVLMLLMLSTILSSRVTSHKSRRIFRELQGKEVGQHVFLKKAHEK